MYFNFGPRFNDGILDINPPAFSGPVYPSFVSKVDKDGNDVAGIRLPPVEAPIATTTGWGLRSAAFGGGPAGGNMDGCESSGQWIAFQATKAGRLAVGDADRVPRADEPCEVGFEALERCPEDEIAARQHLLDGRAHCRADFALLRLKVDKRHPHDRAHFLKPRPR